MYGELVPVGGGDPIPLLKTTLTVGRRESCDVVLRFGNVSGQHCQLTVESGYWFVQDLNSQNGVKVNGQRVSRKRVDPGDEISMAKHAYRLHYTPTDLGANGPPPADETEFSSIMGKSLLDRAGLARKAAPMPGRYNPSNDAAGQMRKRTDD
ncbi:FHA domain containing protein [Pirellula staleyi DSM 6068]|uniref:FHA domain containing protein n=1 Tax=Pirellula staleyi (strain ATCC 27377 / DSM 6068 / ICPB 4128) TaxID=530564 RepID=D2QZB1_PIRSD|nr:FHA domain-containing protein [Pirellula staleyi]ADB18303.1 FHA domain containing protein [Pirellula staleyi DSM 6068]